MDKEQDATLPEKPVDDIVHDGLEEEFSAEHSDALAEVGNISMGAAATALSHMLDKRVQITTPQVSLVSMSNVRTSYPVPCLVINVHYLEGLKGDNIFVLKEKDALVIAGQIMGLELPQGPAELGEMELSAISEAMNQMMGSAATAMSEFLNRFVNISPPQVNYLNLQKNNMGLDYIHDESVFIQVAFHIVIEDILDSNILQLIPIAYGLQTANYLLAGLTGGDPPGDFAGDPAEDFAADEVETGAGTAAEEVTLGDTEILAALADATVAEEETLQPEAVETGRVAGPADEHPAWQNNEGMDAFPEMEQTIVNRQEKKYGLQQEDFDRINLIKDIPVEINVVLGRVSLPLRQVFSLSPGKVFSLENYAGESVELLANERLVAKGEVVLVNGKFGVKVTNIVGPKFG